MRRRRKHAIAVDIAAGALAGAAATWLMGRATTFLYEREDPRAREREEEARGGETAYATAAGQGAMAVGEELTREERQRFGSALHWAVGIAAGAAYGALHRRVPAIGLGRGLLYGAGLWLVLDEIGNWALGLTPGPGEFPWQAHARGLAGHLVLGSATDAALELAARTR